MTCPPLRQEVLVLDLLLPAGALMKDTYGYQVEQ